MSLPRTLTEPQGPTRAHPGGGPAPGRPAGPPRVALVLGGSPRQTGELETQLRKRLRAAAVLTAVFAAVEIAIHLPFALPALRAAPWEALTRSGAFLGVVFLIGCLEAGLAARLSSRRPTTLRRLRATEWLVIGPVLAYSGWSAAVTLAARLPAVLQAPTTFGHAHCLPWTLLVVGYGVIIPNTWRRCAAMVGLILLVGFLPDVLIVPGGGAPAEAAFLYLATKALWLGVSAAIVVYGSYRVEVLRQEVVEARKLGQYLLRQRLGAGGVGSSRVDLQACKLEYSIVSPK